MSFKPPWQLGEQRDNTLLRKQSLLNYIFGQNQRFIFASQQKSNKMRTWRWLGLSW